MKDQNKLIEIIKKYVTEPYQEAILNEIRPSIRLKTTGTTTSIIGKTKLGGCPDLAKNITWPTSPYDHNPLSFLGQINCEEVQRFDVQKLLPQQGMLYFFFNLDSGDDGKVIYSEVSINLEKTIPPVEFHKKKKSFLQKLFSKKVQQSILKESQVEIYNEYHVPSWDSLYLERIQKNSKTNLPSINAFKEDFFENCYEKGETENTSNHHLLGNYKGIQNEYHELNCLDTSIEKFTNMTLTDIKKALQWKLLFQFDSDDHLEISWGDWGRIYFFIHEEDLKNKNFNNIKISADCY